MEVKVMFTLISCAMTAIVLSQIILVNSLLGFLLIMGIGMYIFGDIVIGYMITKTHATYVIDKPPQGYTVNPIFTITGLLDFVWAQKKPYGKREFVYNKQEASVIDKGDYPIHMLNGGHGCVIHESCDENINMYEVKYAEDVSKELGTDNLKEMYSKAKNMEHKPRVIGYDGQTGQPIYETEVMD
jgi:hypothetical protein